MRKWRVGTVSMGLSLVMLGIFLFVTQINGTPMLESLMIWWPLILIVLGIEISAYIFFSKQENPVLKYDFLSIFFVAVLGTIGIGFAVLSSTGIMQELQSVVGAEEKTYSLPALEQKLSDGISKIVIDTGSQPLSVESSASNELHMFGTYRTAVYKDQPPIVETEDYTMIEAVGDTLYLYMKDPMLKTGPLSTATDMETTIIVPQKLKLEIRSDSYQSIDLYPGALANHWIIDHEGNLNINIRENSDISLSAISKNNMDSGLVDWDSVYKASRDGQEEVYKGILEIGEGTYNLAIFNSSYISVKLIE